jgi:hypothetical protein
MSVRIDQRRCGHDGCIAWRLSRPDSDGETWRPCWSCRIEAPPSNNCICADYAETRCDCHACLGRYLALLACPRRLELTVSDQARNDRLYDGLCDECFVQAREIHACGQRLAEHMPGGEPPLRSEPARMNDYRCSGCGVTNRAIHDLAGMRHTTTGHKPSGCTGTYTLARA